MLVAILAIEVTCPVVAFVASPCKKATLTDLLVLSLQEDDDSGKDFSTEVRDGHDLFGVTTELLVLRQPVTV